MTFISNLKQDIASYYKGKKVLITGGLGFIGSNIAIELVEMGATVTLFDNMNPDYGGNFFNIQKIKSQVQVITADILDE